MPEHLDDRLAGLRSAAIPPLAPAAAVRGRGEQRRSRQRAGLAAAAVAFTAAGVFGAVALTAGGSTRPDSLQPAPFATQPRESPPPAPAPAVSPAALLDAEMVAAIRGGAWTAAQPDREDPYAVVAACPEGPAPAAHGLVRTLDGPGDQWVTNQVLRYEDERAAGAAWSALVESVERCPSRPEDSEDGQATVEHELVELDGAEAGRAFGTATARDCAGCAARTTHFWFAQVGTLVALLRLVGGELDELPSLAEAAEQQARCTDGTCRTVPVVKDPPPARWPATDAFLPPEGAAEAEQPGWVVDDSYEPPDAPLADPCGEGSAPASEDVVQVVERAMGSSREAGGSSLAQEVYRYSSPGAAARAFTLYDERYARCAEVADPNGTDGQTIRYEVVDRTPDRLLVRRIPCMSYGCTEHFSTYEMVVRAQDAVTAVAYAIAEDGDPAEEARALLVAVERRLREVVR